MNKFRIAELSERLDGIDAEHKSLARRLGNVHQAEARRMKKITGGRRSWTPEETRESEARAAAKIAQLDAALEMLAARRHAAWTELREIRGF